MMCLFRQAVLVDNPKSTPHLPHPHYLALIHLFDPSTRRYGHFAYRFQAEPPFMLLGRKAIIRPECLLSSVI